MINSRRPVQRIATLFIRKIGQGMVIPPWFGVAWVEEYARLTVCMPIPLNVLAHLLRGIWLWLRFGYMPVACSPREAFAQGFAAGKRERTP